MVKITISSNPPVQVNWYSGMNAQNALEAAYAQITFGVTYYGSTYGYMVVMLNSVYDAPNSGMYWEFFYNTLPAKQGIDSTILNDGDSISFNNVQYNKVTHKNTLLEIKHQEARKV